MTIHTRKIAGVTKSSRSGRAPRAKASSDWGINAYHLKDSSFALENSLLKVFALIESQDSPSRVTFPNRRNQEGGSGKASRRVAIGSDLTAIHPEESATWQSTTQGRGPREYESQGLKRCVKGWNSAS